MYGSLRRTWVAVSVLAALAAIGCREQPANQGTAQTQAPDTANSAEPTNADTGADSELAKMAREIAQDVAEIRETSPSGTKGPVFVFEEYHTSRVGQLQIAVMLVRLYERHGLRLIGLEGAIQSPEPMNATWFHRAGGPGAKEGRAEVAVRMLAEGEISSAEFMAMVFSDVKVRGLENEQEYKRELDTEGSPEVVYLVGIAEKLLKPADIKKVNELMEQEEVEAAFEYMMNADPWLRETYRALKDPPTSVGATIRLLRGIRDKARELAVHVEPDAQEGLDKAIRFYEVARKRSDTIGGYHVGLIGTTKGAPSAMITGAGHSEEITKLLQERHVSYVLLRPQALNPTYANLSLEEFERKNKRQWARTSKGTLGWLLNAQRKPPPIIGTVTGRSYASAVLAANLTAEAARDGRRVPQDIRERIATLPELRVDWDSFTLRGYDVIFRIWLKDTAGRDRELWARVGTMANPDQAKTLEHKLLQSIADLGGGGKVPPRDPPRDSEPTGDKQGPGDGRRGKYIISRTGRRALMVVAESRAVVIDIGQLSN